MEGDVVERRPASERAQLNWASVQEEALAHFKALLRIDTQNPPGNERPAVDYIAAVFDREGIEYQIFEPEPTRANLVARLPAYSATGGEGPLLLSGHLDVVPANADRFRYPPFEAVEAGGYIWARGAIDMKNMVAMSMMSLILAKRSGLRLNRDLIFAAVADEEAGSALGSLYLTEEHPELVRSQYVLNEVGGYTLHLGKNRVYPIQVAEKGFCVLELTALGEPGHGSMPKRDNPVLCLAQAVARLGKTRLPYHPNEVVSEFILGLAAAAPMPQRQLLPLLLSERFAPPILKLLESQDPGMAMALNAMLRNTATPTGLKAGKKVNVIPGRATATIDGRVLPHHTLESFLAEVRSVIGPEIHLEATGYRAGSSSDIRTPLYELLSEVLMERDPGSRVLPYMVPGFTDSHAYARLGAICYGFTPIQLGPELSFARMYHGDDERIPVDGFRWGMRTFWEVIERFCAVI